MAGIEGILPVQQSFNGGEIGPLVAARIDQTRYQTGCKIMKNCIPLVQGPVTRRPGTRFLGATKNQDAKTRIIPFIFSEDQARILELGDRYIRFWTEDGYILGGESATKTFNHSINGNTGWDFTTQGTQNFTVPVTGNYLLECVGGGSGCIQYRHQHAASGSGGGYAKVQTFLTEGTNIPIVVGAGGRSLGPGVQWNYCNMRACDNGGTSSIGAYVSAYGGTAPAFKLGYDGSCNIEYRRAIGGSGAGGIVANGGNGVITTDFDWVCGWHYGGAGGGGLGYGNGGSSENCGSDSNYSVSNGGKGFCRVTYVSQ